MKRTKGIPSVFSSILKKHERKFVRINRQAFGFPILQEVSYNCLSKGLREMGKHTYQRTAIDECTRVRFACAFYGHTPEDTVKFFKILQKAFPFKITKIWIDNGMKFTFRFSH